MKRAFTILEMLVATALTAVLLLAVFHIIGSLALSRIASSDRASTSAWRVDFLQMLRRDLINSTTWDIHRDGFTLTGHGGLHRDTLAVDHEPVTVTYRIESIHGRNWLVRSQTSRADLSDGSAWTELICPEVRRFSLRSASSVTNGATDGVIIPPIVSISLDGDSDSSVNEIMVLR